MALEGTVFQCGCGCGAEVTVTRGCDCADDPKLVCCGEPMVVKKEEGEEKSSCGCGCG